MESQVSPSTAKASFSHLPDLQPTETDGVRPQATYTATRPKTGAKQAVIILASVNAGVMLLRFTEQCLLAKALGAGQRLDAYFLGQVIILLAGQAGVAVTTAAVPILAQYEIDDFQAATKRLLATSIPWIVIALALTAVLSGPIVDHLGGKYDPVNRQLARAILLWLLPATGATVVAGVLRGYWYAQRDFVLPGVGQLFMPLCTCAGAALVALAAWDLRFAAAVANVGALALVLVLYRPVRSRLPGARSAAISYRHLKGVARRFWTALLPVGAGLAMLPAMVAASRSFASWLSPGSVTAISLAGSLASIPGQFAAASVGMVLLPQTSVWKAAGRMGDAARMVERALCNTAFIAIPCAIILALWPQQIVDIVFQRGAFDRAAVGLTASALMGYSFGIPALAGLQVLVFALFGMLGARQVARMAVVTLLLNLLLSRALLPFGVSGVAGAFSLACCIDAAFLLWLLAKRVPELRLGHVAVRHFRILAISAVAGVAGRVLGGIVETSTRYTGLSFVITLAVVAAIYLGINLLVATPEIEEILSTVRSRFAPRTVGDVLSAAE